MYRADIDRSSAGFSNTIRRCSPPLLLLLMLSSPPRAGRANETGRSGMNQLASPARYRHVLPLYAMYVYNANLGDKRRYATLTLFFRRRFYPSTRKREESVLSTDERVGLRAGKGRVGLHARLHANDAFGKVSGAHLNLKKLTLRNSIGGEEFEEPERNCKWRTRNYRVKVEREKPLNCE